MGCMQAALWRCAGPRRPSSPRTHWGASERIHVRVERLRTQRPRADVAVRTHRAPALSYRREALCLLRPWSVPLSLAHLPSHRRHPSDCDKSFTRSDTLAKHLRQQHNLAAPAPTRGGYRKRKRSPSPPAAPPQPPPQPRSPEEGPSGGPAPSHYNFAHRSYASREAGFNTFRVNPPVQPPYYPPVAPLQGPPPSLPPLQGYGHPAYPHPSVREPEVVSESEGDDDPVGWDRDKYGGRSRAMVKYIIMKAKHRFVVEENKHLQLQYESLRRQERTEFDEKEVNVDHVLRGFGYVLSPIPSPP
ncbi:hypothetical protein M422DRAFT_28719 [Sphaerobolus stellatus SS14]|uniref:C2H2-type domain-containing protein n=1 Tax=Sphaerobolus stellatus (strain SS14) TaxID=990650 RepID=A0A0C9VIZ9_SPHS4|nr:hypothetical protein M422DRAFT_28719 [Sphaerobolus stellatus SS14]